MSHAHQATLAAAPPPLTRRRARVRLLRRVALAAFLAWPLLAWAAARALVVEAQVAHPEAVVVLSGSADYVERTRGAAQLFTSGRAPKIILTNDNGRGGWSSTEQRNPYFIERAAAELAAAGVPSEQVELIPQAVANTYEEARVVREYATQRGLRSLLVLTSAYHSRRAWWTWREVFRGSGIELGIETAPADSHTPAPVSWWLSVRGWRAVAAEYPKFIYYRLRYS